MQLRREETLDAIQRLVGVVGVQRAQTEVACFREGQSLGHGLGGAHLTDHDDVRRLAQGIFQGYIERLGIHTHLALGDDTVVVVVQEFDGVLYADDVAVAVVVAVSHHGRQRGGFTGTGGADKNHQAALGHRQFIDDGRQAQFFDRGDLGVDQAQHQPALAALYEGAGAETPHPLDAEGVITLVVLEKRFLLVIAHGREHQFPGLLFRQRRLGNRQNLPVDLDARPRSGGDESVGCLVLYHSFQQLLNLHSDSLCSPATPLWACCGVWLTRSFPASWPSRGPHPW